MKPISALRLFLTVLILICSATSSVKAQLVQAYHVQEGIMPLYFGNAENLDHFNPSDLERLRKAGINQLIVGGYHVPDFVKIINAFSTNGVLNKFKVILAFHLPTYDAYAQCIQDPNCNKFTDLTQFIKGLLDEVIPMAKNSPVVAGYYTFDEPAAQDKIPNQNNWGVCKEFQINLYNYLRNLDPDVNARPVSIGNTVAIPGTTTPLSDDRIKFAMSNNAQDINFIDQYNDNVDIQKSFFAKWKGNDLYGKPYVFILPATNGSACAQASTQATANAIHEALDYHFGVSTWPVVAGVGFFAYWPEEKPDFEYGIDNCPVLMDEVTAYLNALPTGLMAKWKLDLDNTNSGPQGGSATLVGSPDYANQYYVEGKGSVYFNGNGQGIQLSPTQGFLKNAFKTRTIMFWVQPVAANATQMLYEEGDSGNGIAIRNNLGVLQVATVSGGGANHVFNVPGFNFQDGVWNHIGVVLSWGRLKVYVDGEEKLSTTTYTTINEHWDAVGLGIVQTTVGTGNAFGAGDVTAPFYGFVDEVQLYDIALCAEKVFFTSQALFAQFKWNNNVVNEGSGATSATLTGGATYTINNDSYEGARALNLNGAQQGAQLSASNDYLKAEIKKRTIMFWMRPGAINTSQMLYEEGDSGNGIAIRLNAGNYLEVGVASPGVNYIYTASSNPVNANTWYRVAVVFNAGAVTLYLDNHKAGFNFTSAVVSPHWDPAAIGMTITNGGIGNAFGASDNTGSFTGAIDDVKIYNSAVPEAYIAGLCLDCGVITPLRFIVRR